MSEKEMIAPSDQPDCPPATVQYEPIAEHDGTVIGLYKLMEQIGEGGFGLVFVAEQQQPVRRKVALKISSRGWTRATSSSVLRLSGRHLRSWTIQTSPRFLTAAPPNAGGRIS
jgi:hypothetical protein